MEPLSIATLIDAFIFLDTTRTELGPIPRAASTQYLRTEGGFNPEDAERIYHAWTDTYDPDMCAEDCVDNYVSRSPATPTQPAGRPS